MGSRAYLVFVLHTHQPFVAQPSPDVSFEENWLFEAITESYIPLLDMCHRFLADGVNAKLTFSLTPTLAAMLENSAMQRKYLRYVEERVAALDATSGGNTAERMHYHRFLRNRDLFDRLWQCDLISAFRQLQEHGLISLLASAATHAYLPLWQPLPNAVQLQIEVGIAQYRAAFGRDPLGFWLPECGFYPGIDAFLRAAGIRFFFVDGHGLLNATPRPVYGFYAPVHTPNGVAALGRDAGTHDQVWRKETGYPGDPAYLSMHGEPSHGLRVRSSDETGSSYDPSRAYARCLDHARHFVSQCRERIRHLSAIINREPLIVAMFDTEHFGHWWHEGTQWLDLAIRMLAAEVPELKMITAEEYLRIFPTNQEAMPSMSSWGWGGYSETWLMGRNDWIYRELFQAMEALESFLTDRSPLRTEQRACVEQYLREFMLAQSSDWAYMLHREQNIAYVEKKLQGYLQTMRLLLSMARQESFDIETLRAIQRKSSIFLDIDLLSMYSRASGSEPMGTLRLGAHG